MASSLPPLYALRAFESAARTGSFTLAADALHLTPSAVSKHIKTLEQHFGCRLFQRNGPRIEVTPQGKIFAAELQQGFARIEQACELFRSHRDLLRLKAPSTLTLRWLLDCLSRFRQTAQAFDVQAASVWMDIDSVDFFSEPYDCAILLGNGHFGANTAAAKLFDEWLIPICAPALLADAQRDLATCPLIHPSPDRRDWRRWLQKSGIAAPIALTRGQVFDSLEQGNAAAIAGHGVSIGDLALSLRTIEEGLLAVPCDAAVRTGDGYYLVWPEESAKRPLIERLQAFLAAQTPDVSRAAVRFIG